MPYSRSAVSTHQEKSSWPFRRMAAALGISIVLSAFVLPPPGGLEVFRDLMYLAVMAVFLARWRLAAVRREQNRAWFFYIILILAAPLMILLSEPVLKAL